MKADQKKQYVEELKKLSNEDLIKRFENIVKSIYNERVPFWKIIEREKLKSVVAVLIKERMVKIENK